MLRRPRGMLLLPLVTFGLFLMHTLGHADTRHGSHGVPATVTAHGHAVTAHPAGEAGLSAAESPPSAPGMGMDPTAICLAVLCAVAAALLAVAELRADRHRATLPSSRPAGTPRGRGPPWRPLGLILADLSVLRH